jgi:hypothetical protein
MARRVPGHASLDWYEPSPTTSEPHFVSLFDLNDQTLTATTYKWSSWLSQQTSHPCAAKSWTPGIRLFAEGPFEPVLSAVVRKAFFGLSMSYLKDLAEHLGIDVSGGKCLFELLVAMLQSILNIDELEATRLTHQRLIRWTESTQWGSELLEIDEAIEVLDRNDHKVVRDEQASVVRDLQAREVFSVSYKSAANRLFAKAKAKGAAKRGKALPRALAVPEVILQAEARKFIPDGASIWKGNTHQDWNGHFKPHKTVSFKWSHHTEPTALKLTIGSLWAQFLEFHGHGDEVCPYPTMLALART